MKTEDTNDSSPDSAGTPSLFATRLIEGLKVYASSAKAPPAEQPAAGTSGALKTAFTRASKYNDASTRTSLETTKNS